MQQELSEARAHGKVSAGKEDFNNDYGASGTFFKRMQEANIDYGLRCLLMGHKTTRPVYGDGGSLEYRRDELLKIVHPFDARVMELFERGNPEW